LRCGHVERAVFLGAMNDLRRVFRFQHVRCIGAFPSEL